MVNGERWKMSVCILMSTYNGEKFIDEQIKSILNQSDVDVALYIRDDGSTDNTVDILKRYLSNYKEIELVVGRNVGVKRSFAELVLSAPESDYYAFADQDDVWYQDKLLTAINKLKELNDDTPCLYLSNQNCVDSNGTFLYERFSTEYSQPELIYSVFNNEYSGCTMVFNKRLFEKLYQFYKYLANRDTILQDVAAVLVAQITGTIVYDSEPHMDFRRHGDNCTEAKLYSTMQVKDRIKQLKRKFFTLKKLNKNVRGRVRLRCKYLLECFSEEISDNNREQLRYFAEYADSAHNWLKFLFNNKYRKAFPKPYYATYLMIFFQVY